MQLLQLLTLVLTIFSPTTAAVNCKSSKNGVYPVIQNCTQYITCINGLAFKAGCPTGYVFDKINSKCDLKEATTCNLDRSKGARRLMGSRCAVEGDIHPRSFSCEKFLLCQNQKYTVASCPPSKVFIYNSYNCEIPPDPCSIKTNFTTSTNVTSPYIDICEDRNGRRRLKVAEPFHCHLYVACLHSTIGGYKNRHNIKIFPCPPGTLFSRISGECHNPATVVCDTRYRNFTTYGKNPLAEPHYRRTNVGFPVTPEATSIQKPKFGQSVDIFGRREYPNMTNPIKIMTTVGQGKIEPSGDSPLQLMNSTESPFLGQTEQKWEHGPKGDTVNSEGTTKQPGKFNKPLNLSDFHHNPYQVESRRPLASTHSPTEIRMLYLDARNHVKLGKQTGFGVNDRNNSMKWFDTGNITGDYISISSTETYATISRYRAVSSVKTAAARISTISAEPSVIFATLISDLGKSISPPTVNNEIFKDKILDRVSDSISVIFSTEAAHSIEITNTAPSIITWHRQRNTAANPKTSPKPSIIKLNNFNITPEDSDKATTGLLVKTIPMSFEKTSTHFVHTRTEHPLSEEVNTVTMTPTESLINLTIPLPKGTTEPSIKSEIVIVSKVIDVSSTKPNTSHVISINETDSKKSVSSISEKNIIYEPSSTQSTPIIAVTTTKATSPVITKSSENSESVSETTSEITKNATLSSKIEISSDQIQPSVATGSTNSSSSDNEWNDTIVLITESSTKATAGVSTGSIEPAVKNKTGGATSGEIRISVESSSEAITVPLVTTNEIFSAKSVLNYSKSNISTHSSTESGHTVITITTKQPSMKFFPTGSKEPSVQTKTVITTPKISAEVLSFKGTSVPIITNDTKLKQSGSELGHVHASTDGVPSISTTTTTASTESTVGLSTGNIQTLEKSSTVASVSETKSKVSVKATHSILITKSSEITTALPLTEAIPSVTLTTPELLSTTTINDSTRSAVPTRAAVVTVTVSNSESYPIGTAEESDPENKIFSQTGDVESGEQFTISYISSTKMSNALKPERTTKSSNISIYSHERVKEKSIIADIEDHVTLANATKTQNPLTIKPNLGRGFGKQTAKPSITKEIKLHSNEFEQNTQVQRPKQNLHFEDVHRKRVSSTTLSSQENNLETLEPPEYIKLPRPIPDTKSNTFTTSTRKYEIGTANDRNEMIEFSPSITNATFTPNCSCLETNKFCKNSNVHRNSTKLATGDFINKEFSSESNESPFLSPKARKINTWTRPTKEPVNIPAKLEDININHNSVNKSTTTWVENASSKTARENSERKSALEEVEDNETFEKSVQEAVAESKKLYPHLSQNRRTYKIVQKTVKETIRNSTNGTIKETMTKTIETSIKDGKSCEYESDSRSESKEENLECISASGSGECDYSLQDSSEHKKESQKYPLTQIKQISAVFNPDAHNISGKLIDPLKQNILNSTKAQSLAINPPSIDLHNTDIKRKLIHRRKDHRNSVKEKSIYHSSAVKTNKQTNTETKRKNYNPNQSSSYVKGNKPPDTHKHRVRDNSKIQLNIYPGKHSRPVNIALQINHDTIKSNHHNKHTHNNKER